MLRQFIDHPVHDRLYFAEHRLQNLRALNGGDLAGAPRRERQSLVQEFFFHLCGAIDFLAQEVNNIRNLHLSEEDVTVSKVCSKLPATDPIRQALSELHPTTRNKPLPQDPYSDDGSHFRIMLFRNFVSHIQHNPFHFTFGGPGDRSVNLSLDPREPHGLRKPSQHEAFNELTAFLDLVTSKCNRVLAELKIL